MKKLFFLSFIIMLSSCSKKEEVADQVDQDIFLGVGKWKIKQRSISSGKFLECNLTDLILNSDLSFKIYFENNNVIVGTYQVIDLENISLNGSEGAVGTISNIKVEGLSISFDIDLTGVCQDSLEGEKDEAYQENKTFIADVEFEKYLIEQGWDDVIDNYVLTSNISNVGFVDLQNRGIFSLTGIEDFENLEGLSAGNNKIDGILDLSNNIKLTNVDLPHNPITELYLKNNPYLENLWIYNTNTLEIIEITNSQQLYSLTTHNNKLTELDLSNSPNIFNLRIWDSRLKKLDLSFMSKLEYLVAWDTFDESNEGEILLPTNSSLKVVALGYNRLKEIDLSKSVKIERLELNGNEISNIDFSQNPLIEYMDIANNLLGQLDISPIQSLFWLRAQSNFFNCIQLRDDQLNEIPPSCVELNIPDYSETEEETCYNSGAWIEEDFFPREYTISSTWVVDDGVIFSTNCN